MGDPHGIQFRPALSLRIESHLAPGCRLAKRWRPRQNIACHSLAAGVGQEDNAALYDARLNLVVDRPDETLNSRGSVAEQEVALPIVDSADDPIVDECIGAIIDEQKRRPGNQDSE